jgi:hypothetical protein
MSTAVSKQAVKGRQPATRNRGVRQGPRGSLINFDDRDPNNHRRVAVKCGGPCGQWFRWRKYPEWPGRCPDCSLVERRERGLARREQRGLARAANPPQRRKLEPIVRLPESDIVIERDPARPTYGWVRCPVCQERRRVHIPTGKKRQSFTGRCRRHQPARGQRRGVLLHTTGTEIFFDEREPGNYQKVAARCHGCGEKKFVWIHELRRETWSGLCHDCIKQRRPYNRLDEDLTLPSGSIIHLGAMVTQDKWRTVPVTCGACGERWHPRRWHALKSRSDPNWSGLCPDCRHNPTRASARVRERALQADAGQGLQSEPSAAASIVEQFHPLSATAVAKIEKRRGRREGVKYIDPQRSRDTLESAILKLWALHQSISSITFAEIARVYESAGERVGADAVKKRFYDLGTGQKWRDFVLSVVNKKGN